MDLCTVISERFIPQALNLIQSYKINSYNKKTYLYYFNTERTKLSIFNETFGDSVELIEVDKVCEHAHSPRVFFYKTFALYDCFLNRTDELIYSDSANCFIRPTDTLDRDLVDNSLFMVYPYSGLTNQYWCTQKSISIVGAMGSEIMPQYWAGFQAYKKSYKNVKFVKDMYEHMLDPNMALPDTTVRYPDGPSSPCIEHRQDQAVFSLLIHKHNRHQPFDPVKNTKYGDWQTLREFDRNYNHDFNKMVLSPRESKFNNFRFLNV